MKVVVFEKSWGASELHDDINEWLEDNNDVHVKDIKYGYHDGYHSALIMYETGVKL